MDKNLTDIIYQYKTKKLSYPDGLDCAVFTAKILEEYHGKIIPGWREITTYTTPEGAQDTIKRLGCKEFHEVPGKILGDGKKKDISKVKLGEPVYYINENGAGILGVCNGARCYFLQNGGGITARKTEDCSYCWSID